MELEHFHNEMASDCEFDDFWNNFLNASTNEYQPIDPLLITNSSDIIEQDHTVQFDGDVADLIESEDFSHYLNTLNENLFDMSMNEAVTLQDQATSSTTEQSPPNHDRKFNQHPYPPTGTLATTREHDRPYFEFSSYNVHDLVKQYAFDLEGKWTRERRISKKIRLNTHALSFLTRTRTTKQEIIDFILKTYENSRLKYVCIGETPESKKSKPTLGIQIIVGKIKNIQTMFLDSITNDDDCNYHVTPKDAPWNHYIKRTNKFLEYGEFYSVFNRFR